ncbi:hypothetical protein JT359_09085, partial [Candidatus Poribacteria bacterium]|nr:hypothetical protein [Candidatus Poribacteria bacterium]
MELVDQDFTKWGLPLEAISRVGKGQINDVIFSPDGKLLVVATSIGIWLYDVFTGEEVALIASHTSSINAVVFSPDGSTLVSGGSDAKIHLWDLTTHSPVSTFKGHTASVDTLAFSPDGTILASASQVMSDKVRLWDFNNDSEHTIPLGYWSSASSIAFSPNCEVLAIVDRNGSIHYYNSITGASQPHMSFPRGKVNSFAFSPNGKIIASGHSDNTIWLFDVDIGKSYRKLTKHKQSITSLVFSPDGDILASTSLDKTLRFWDVRTGKQIFSFMKPEAWSNVMVFSNDGATFVSVENSGRIHFYDVTSWKEILTISGHTCKGIGPMIFSPNGRKLASESLFNQETIKLLNVSTKEECTISKTRSGRSNRLAFSPDSGILASGSLNEIDLWNVKTRTHISTFGDRKSSGIEQKIATNILDIPPSDGHTGWVSALVFSHNSQLLASGGNDNKIRLWSLLVGAEVASPGSHHDWVTALCFSNDSRLLASGCIDGRIKLWDIQNLFTHDSIIHNDFKPSMYQVETFLGTHENSICSLTFSSDNNILASGDEDGTIRLWDISSNLPLSTLTGHTGAVYTLCFLLLSQVIIDGYSRFSFIRASSVVNLQLVLVCFSFLLFCHA